MAIAFDAITGATYTGTSSPSLSSASTSSGADVVGIVVLLSSNVPTGITWGGVAMSQILSVTSTIQVWALANPGSGVKTIAITFSGNNTGVVYAGTYTGVSQTTILDAQTTRNTGAGLGDVSDSVTTVGDGAWSILLIENNAGYTESTGTTARKKDLSNTNTLFWGDSNSAKSPPGAVTMAATRDGGGTGTGAYAIISIKQHQQITMTASWASFILTGIAATLHVPILHMTATVANFSLTGVAARLTKSARQWTNASKSSTSTFTNTPKS